jgi:hypothetical protein
MDIYKKAYFVCGDYPRDGSVTEIDRDDLKVLDINNTLKEAVNSMKDFDKDNYEDTSIWEVKRIDWSKLKGMI